MKKIILLFIILYSFITNTLLADDLEYNLTDAINRSDFEQASELIKKGADVNKKIEPFNQTPIIIASLRGTQFVRLLVDNGANINARDQDNTTALINACLYGNTEAAIFLISKGADIHAKNNDDMTVLEAAKISENKYLISYVKSKGAK